MGIIFVVFFEREIYECKNLNRKFVLRTARKWYKKCFDRSRDSISALNIPHIYSWESSAYYHGYGLAELGVYQWKRYLFNKYGYIVDNPRIGKELIKMWSYASLYPAKKLIKLATGEPLSPAAFVKSVTKPLERVISDAKDRIKRLERVPEHKSSIDLNAKIFLVHGKKKIADNSKSFEDMDRKYRKWLTKDSK